MTAAAAPTPATKRTFGQTLDQLIRSKQPVILIETHEETVATSLVQQIADHQNRRRVMNNEPEKLVVTWSCTQGFMHNNEQVFLTDTMEGPIPTVDPIVALQTMLEVDLNGNSNIIFVLLDAHDFFSNTRYKRAIRDVARDFYLHAARFARTAIFVSARFEIPTEIEHEVTLLSMPLPNRTELAAVLEQAITTKLDEVQVDDSETTREALISAMQSLTRKEAANVLSLAQVTTRALDMRAVKIINDEKAAIVKSRGLLEVIPYRARQSGGNDLLSKYGRSRRKALLRGVDPSRPRPKAVLAVGVPGTGKSLFAEVFAGEDLQLLRADLGRVKGSLVGQSQANLREMFRTVEAFGLCALMFDEFEKQVGGSGESDGNTSNEMIGALLTWMQEQETCYIIATANDVSMIRPELLRRFDDIFFVDVPQTDEERVEILAITLKMYKRDPELFNLHAVAQITDGYTGAELRKVVESAMFDADDEEEELSTQHMIAARQSVVPIVVTMSEKIENLRAWARNRARYASSTQELAYQSKAQRMTATNADTSALPKIELADDFAA